MLETLAGPFDVVNLDGDSVITTFITQTWAYHDDIGVIYFSGGTGSSQNTTYVVQLDGTACNRSNGYSNFLIYDLDPSNYGELLARQHPFNNHLSTWDKFACVVKDELLFQGGVVGFSNHQIRLADRFLMATHHPISRVKWHPLGVPVVSFEDEAVLTNAGTGSIPPAWSMTRNPNILAIAYRDGAIVYYDHVNKVQMPGVANIGTNKGAWYSPRHNIWIKINSANQLVIHAATPRPSAMTAPSGSAALRGRTTTFSVTVTGDAGEPCPDELISWSLLSGAIGQLKATQSRTNQNGQASIDYIAPVIGALSDVTIRAELKF